MSFSPFRIAASSAAASGCPRSFAKQHILLMPIGKTALSCSHVAASKMRIRLAFGRKFGVGQRQNWFDQPLPGEPRRVMRGLKPAAVEHCEHRANRADHCAVDRSKDGDQELGLSVRSLPSLELRPRPSRCVHSASRSENQRSPFSSIS